jgi:N-formylglutamate amidohydrolase
MVALADPAIDESPPPLEVLSPAAQVAPVVIASPHSGADYPPDFVAASRLDPLALRRSEDSFVDELFAAAPRRGLPMLVARFPRAYLDVNREPWELDPTMFADSLPDFVNTRSYRVAGGLGTIARVVTNGAEIYRGKLRFADAVSRIERLYRPYHRTLARLLSATRERFGVAVLVDCHSMPSVGGPLDADAGTERADVVLGDRYGTSCAAALTDRVHAVLEARGYVVRRNAPYAGGYATRHYGRPGDGVHALQIEINRALYMDEVLIRRDAGMAEVSGAMTAVVESLAALQPRDLA